MSSVAAVSQQTIILRLQMDATYYEKNEHQWTQAAIQRELSKIFVTFFEEDPSLQFPIATGNWVLFLLWKTDANAGLWIFWRGRLFEISASTDGRCSIESRSHLLLLRKR